MYPNGRAASLHCSGAALEPPAAVAGAGSLGSCAGVRQGQEVEEHSGRLDVREAAAPQ